jgi:hypothetical protein
MKVNVPYTNDERVERIWDKENVIQTMNRHAFYMSNEMRREAINDLWVQDPQNQSTASLAYNTGYFVGIAEVERQLVVFRDEQRYARLKPYTEANPEIKLCKENLGLGCSEMHTSTTHLVYIADDGKTARFLGYRPAYLSTGLPDGTAKTYFDLGLVFADLIKEGDKWKIWHLVIEHDHTIEAGHNYADTPVKLPEGEHDPLEEDYGTPTIPTTVYNPFFGWEYMFQDMPKPYATYNDKESYGPKGDLGKPYYDRERR